MNETAEKFMREQILIGLNQLTEAHQMIFKRMYSHKNLELPIAEVVEIIPDAKLDHALTQVENTLHKAKKSA